MRLKAVRGTERCCVIKGQHEFLLPSCIPKGGVKDRLRMSASTHVRYCLGLWVPLSIWSYFMQKLQKPKHVFSQ